MFEAACTSNGLAWGSRLGVVHKDEARPSIDDFFHDSTYSRL